MRTIPFYFNVNGHDGSVEVRKNSVKINNKMIGFSYSNWAFKWKDVSGLPFGDGVKAPIEQMHGFRLNANVPYLVNDIGFALRQINV